MNWHLKRIIQNVVGQLPDSISHAVYYQIQRRLGDLRGVNPSRYLRTAGELGAQLASVKKSLVNAMVLEVGTGRRIALPIAYWLMGAQRVITVDLNPYLKAELVYEDIAHIQAHPDGVRSQLGGHLDEDRLDALLAFASRRWDLSELLRFCGIEYISRADAAALSLPAEAIDVHTSYTVLEHIPPATLIEILKEARRVLKPDGVAAHFIDYSDHFAHSDKSLSLIHFLRFSEQEWSELVRSRFMYMNRLRHDDMIELFRRAGHRLLGVETRHAPEVHKVLASGTAPLHPQFAAKPIEALSTIGAWVLSTPTPSAAACGKQS